MKKHICRRVMAVILCLGLLAPNAYAAQSVTPSTAVETQTPRAGEKTITLTHNDKRDVRSLVESAEDGTVFLLEGSATINAKDSNPLVITKRITFRGNSKNGQQPTLIIRPGGILLGNNVTFEDLELGFASAVRNVIMANGYTLKLKNVTQRASSRKIHIACGGLTEGTVISPSGSHGKVIISGKTSIDNIYAGSIAKVDWDPSGDPITQDPSGEPNDFNGNVTIQIENLERNSKIGTIYASGARQTPINPNNWFDQKEPAPPKVDATKFKTSGKVEIHLSGSAVSEVYGETGTAEKAHVYFKGDNERNSNLTVRDAASFHVVSGLVDPNLVNMERALLEVKGGARLYLKKFASKTVGDFTGGGLLVMEPKDTLVINGTITGTTKVSIGSMSTETESKEQPIEKHVYISAKGSASTSKPDAFQLVPYKPNTKWKLLKSDEGEWAATTGEAVSTNKVTSVAVAKPEYSVTKWEPTLEIPLTVTYETQDATPCLERIPIEVKVDNEVVTPKGTPSDGYTYTSKYTKNLKLQFFVTDSGHDGSYVDALEISPQKTPFNADTTYQLEMTVPAQYTTNNQAITFRTALKVTEKVTPPAPSQIDLSKAQVTVQGSSFEYTGQKHEPEVTVVSAEGTSLQKDVHYTLSHKDNVDAGKASVTVNAKSGSDCINSKTVYFTIEKAKLTPQTAAVAEKTYNGTKDAEVTSVTFQRASGQVEALAKDTQYSVSGEFNSENVGQASEVNAVITLLDKTADNYTLTKNTVTVPAKIKQAQATSETGRINVTNKRKASYTYDLSRLLSPLNDGTQYGTAKYTLGTVTLNQYEDTQAAPSISGETLTIPIADVDSKDETQVGTIQINIETENYQVPSATIQIFSVNKQVPIGAPTLTPKSFVYGKPLSTISLSGTMSDGMGGRVEGSFEWEDPTKEYPAGTHQPNWIFTPKDVDQYQTVTDKATVIVEKATPTGTPQYTPITEEKKTLKDANLALGTINVKGTITWDLDSTTEVKANEAYHWTFTPDESSNYHNLTGSVVLYKSAEGGGGQENPDGSTTTVEHTSDGVITTTTYPNGVVNKVEEKNDGTVIKTNTTEHNTVGKVVKDPSGNITEVSGQVSQEAVQASEENGKPVRIPVEVPAFSSSSKAPSIKVDIPAGGAVIEIPVEQLTAGAVVIMVSPDGKEVLIKRTQLTEEGVALELEENSTLKVVDNSQSFSDVKKGDWYGNAVDFMSARELMNGTAKNTFQPGSTLSRGMFAVMLHNLEDKPAASQENHFQDVPDDGWFTEAINWATEVGIMSGYGNGTVGPNKNITREQLAVMLYQYAGSPTVNFPLVGFTDSNAVSSFAKSAMTWAVENGVISGKENNRLDPRGQATRAEAAQMMMNFMN